VARIDPATNTVVATVMVGSTAPGGPHQIDFGLGSAWVSAGVVRDPVRVAAGASGAIVRVDPQTNKIQATIDTEVGVSACGGFAISKLAVWMPSCGDAPNMVRVDPAKNKIVAKIDLEGFGGDAVLIDGFPWLTVSSLSGDGPAWLARVDPGTNKIDKVLGLGASFTGGDLLLADSSVWVTDWANDRVLRLPRSAFAN
jgi:DNA-binding beta-propeller fold protein YncE